MKTNVESELVLHKAALFLQQPLALPAYGQSVMTNLQGIDSLGSLASFAREQLEVGPAMPMHIFHHVPFFVDKDVLGKLPAPVARAIEQIVSATLGLQLGLPQEKSAAFAAFAADTLEMDKDKTELELWKQIGDGTEMGIAAARLEDILQRRHH